MQGCVGWDLCLGDVRRACVRLGVCVGVLGRGGAADSLSVPLPRRAGGPGGCFLPHFFVFVCDQIASEEVFLVCFMYIY